MRGGFGTARRWRGSGDDDAGIMRRRRICRQGWDEWDDYNEDCDEGRDKEEVVRER